MYIASKTDILHSVKQAQGGEHAVILRVVVPQPAIVTAFGTYIPWQHCDSKSKQKSFILTAEFVTCHMMDSEHAAPFGPTPVLDMPACRPWGYDSKPQVT